MQHYAIDIHRDSQDGLVVMFEGFIDRTPRYVVAQIEALVAELSPFVADTDNAENDNGFFDLLHESLYVAEIAYAFRTYHEVSTPEFGDSFVGIRREGKEHVRFMFMSPIHYRNAERDLALLKIAQRVADHYGFDDVSSALQLVFDARTF